MSKKALKIILAAAAALGLTAAGFLWLGHSGGSSASQRVNAALDDLQALGIRILDLPLFMLLAIIAIAGTASMMVLHRFTPRRLKPTQILLALTLVLALFGLAFIADRHINRLQNQISELRGKLNAQRMTIPEQNTPTTTLTQAPAPPSLLASTAASTPAPTTATAITATKPAARDKFLFDPEAAKKALSTNFANPALNTVILDRASDAIELRSLNPGIVAYLSITDLKAPGLEIHFGGSVNAKTYTSDFARANNCSIAINGEAGQSPQMNSGFGPWFGNGISAGKSLMKEAAGNPRPFLTFTRENDAAFTAQIAKPRTISADAFNVVWGRLDAVIDGSVQTASERDRQPRTAMGITKDGSRLILLVVDGRQQQWSLGVTRAEVGLILSAFGASNGMLCDEGGSSCMYLKKFSTIVNSPSDGEERPTYTHFGITLKEPAVAP